MQRGHALECAAVAPVPAPVPAPVAAAVRAVPVPAVPAVPGAVPAIGRAAAVAGSAATAQILLGDSLSGRESKDTVYNLNTAP